MSYTLAKVTQQKQRDKLAPRARPSDTRVTILSLTLLTASLTFTVRPRGYLLYRWMRTNGSTILCYAKSLQLCPTLRPHRQQPTRLPHPWDSPGKNTGVGCHFLLQCMKVESESEVAQSCPTLSDHIDCSLPGSSIHGIFPGNSTGVRCHCLLRIKCINTVESKNGMIISVDL